MYNVFQHWDPLKVCIVGKSYSPEFYKFIKNSRVRSVMERIATETEDDYQKLIELLNSFGVNVLRPDVTDNHADYLDSTGKIMIPPMTPRDYSAMIGEKFYFNRRIPENNRENAINKWNEIKGVSWPAYPPETADQYSKLDLNIKNELLEFNLSDVFGKFDTRHNSWSNVLKQINNPIIYDTGINSAMVTRIGKDLYFGTDSYTQNQQHLLASRRELFPEYRCHVVNSGGHTDGTFCPVVPGLIISLHDIPTYQDTFPDWEVVYLPGQSWEKVSQFLKLKRKNKGKWWVPGEELNDEFTDFVEQWLDKWVGYVEETVFDVNMLVVDQKNVVCNNYNKLVFDALERYGVTPHVINFRHRYFWDGGLHCITSDLHREGNIIDYFPGRI